MSVECIKPDNPVGIPRPYNSGRNGRTIHKIVSAGDDHARFDDVAVDDPVCTHRRLGILE